MAYLSNRLQAIHDMLPKGVIADIGSDHGKLMIALFRSGKLIKGYAIENKKGPYQRLVKALASIVQLNLVIELIIKSMELYLEFSSLVIPSILNFTYIPLFSLCTLASMKPKYGFITSKLDTK